MAVNLIIGGSDDGGGGGVSKWGHKRGCEKEVRGGYFEQSIAKARRWSINNY